MTTPKLRADPEPKVPNDAGSKAAQLLGGGDGMQKLCYVLFLSRYEDDFARQLADAGAILNAARVISEGGTEPEEKTEPERVILCKACRLLSALDNDEMDRWMVRQMKGIRAAEPGSLQARLQGLLASVKLASERVSGFLADHGAALGLEDSQGIKAATDDIVRRLAALEPPDDVPFVGLALRIGREAVPRQTETAPKDITLETERYRAHLRKAVSESRLTQKEIAERAGLTPGTLSSLLREGGAGFHVDRIAHILEAAEVDPAKFYRELFP